MVRGWVRGWVINYTYEGPHKDRRRRMCVCMEILKLSSCCCCCVTVDTGRMFPLTAESRISQHPLAVGGCDVTSGSHSVRVTEDLHFLSLCSGCPNEAGGEGSASADDGQRSLVPEPSHRVHRVRPDRRQTAGWRLPGVSVERDGGVLHRR